MNARKQLHLTIRPRWLFAIGIVSLILWTLWPAKNNHDELRSPFLTTTIPHACVELRPGSKINQDTVIQKPGTYCVAADFWQIRLNGAGHSWPGRSHRLIEVRESDVFIDLRNHILHSDGHSTGIRVSLGELKFSKASTITIKNGVIDLRGIGRGVEAHHKWQMYAIDETVPDGVIDYKEAKIILENLLIKTDNWGVQLTGNGNIIRNCIIESGGNAAIIIAGPNGQIINNTIILTDPFVPGSMSGIKLNEPRDFFDFLSDRNIPKAAIALHQATGTVISGNRIEVKGKSPTRHNIYLTDASENVLIEGNTIVGADDSVTLVKGSTAIMKNNVFEQRRPWWKF